MQVDGAMKILRFFPLFLVGIACGSADLYEVGLNSPEVSDSSLLLSVDEGSSTLTFSLDLRDPDGSDGLCPTLSPTIDVVALADGEPVTVDVVTRGGGDVEVDCAFRCRDLVALAAECTPAIIEISGPGVNVALNATELSFGLRDAEESIDQTIAFEARESRAVEFPEGNSITLMADEIVEAPGVGTTPLLWSHPEDESFWASEWRSGARFESGEVSAFEFSPDVTEPPLALKAVGLPEGEHTVFVGSTTSLSECSFRACSVSRVESAVVVIEHR